MLDTELTTLPIRAHRLSSTAHFDQFASLRKVLSISGPSRVLHNSINVHHSAWFIASDENLVISSDFEKIAPSSENEAVSIPSYLHHLN